MKTVAYAVAIILGLSLIAPRANAEDRSPSPPCDPLDSSCTSNGGACQPDDECCKCKAPCIAQYNKDNASCTLTGPAQTDCVAEALKKMTDCENLCTVDDKCQDA